MGEATETEKLALSIGEAAAMVGISRSYLYQAMDRGEVAYVKLGKRRLIQRSALQVWLQRNEIQEEKSNGR